MLYQPSIFWVSLLLSVSFLYQGIVAAIEDLQQEQQSAILQAMEDPDEVYYLNGLVALHLSKEKDEEQYVAIAEASLQQGLRCFPKGRFSGATIYLLGTLHYQQSHFSQAEEFFASFAAEHPADALAGDALFWASRCTDALQEPEKSKRYRSHVYESYPQSQYAAEAYFLYHTYQEYLQGDRAAIKHLQAMPKRYPKSLFTMNAWYLIGLDNKRDRKTAAGKWICKKNLTAATDAFQKVESTFSLLFQEGVLTGNALEYYVSICYRATLERALTHLAIVEESQGAKRQIYLEYATDVLRQIDHDFKNPQHPFSHQLSYLEACVSIREESAYWLAQAYLKGSQDLAAERVLMEMLEKYRSAKATRGYFLSRAWYDLGCIAGGRKDYREALQCYEHAEDTAKGKVLSTDQRLDLWIQQSLCYQALDDMDQAILVLSKVVNDDAISGLRIKAMYLRAEIYELQGRLELARKQLEATSKKGGEWSLKAQEKLDQAYGCQ